MHDVAPGTGVDYWGVEPVCVVRYAAVFCATTGTRQLFVARTPGLCYRTVPGAAWYHVATGHHLMKLAPCRYPWGTDLTIVIGGQARLRVGRIEATGGTAYSAAAGADTG